MKVLLLPLLAFLAIGGAGAAKELEEVQGGYSVEPLRKPIFDTAEVLVDAAAFNNWLNENHSTLTPETMKGPREHLYYLIGSRVADLYARNGQVFPQDDDLILASLFSWSERLGVFGGHLVYNVLRQDGSPPMEPLMPTPKGVELGLSGDMLVLRAPSEHWSVSFPYYFMVWNMAEFDTNQGMRTQVIALSTGAARHKERSRRRNRPLHRRPHIRRRRKELGRRHRWRLQTARPHQGPHWLR